MSRRTPTPNIDRIWHPETTTHRWHQLWIAHLTAQTTHNPDHPGRDDLPRYQAAAAEYQHHPWTAELEKQEQQTRHDLQAALDVFNRHANATTAHLGLTSHDITEHATQDAIHESLRYLINRTHGVAAQLHQQTQTWRDTPLLARTHGQPAQTTSYGYRIATILAPLRDWISRAEETLSNYPARPPYGAVGNAADLTRVIGDADLTDYLAVKPRMAATRQIYHRSYDLPIANAMVELTSIAQTWATDRRLEAMLGLGNETRTDGQVGSSAMAHKTNPVLCERICSLASLTLGHYTTIAALASQGWLEGDVSTSGARREVWPALFSNVDAILTNWLEALRRFKPDENAMRHELRQHAIEASTGAVLQWLVEHGVARDVAHTSIRATSRTAGGGFMGWATRLLTVAGLDPSRPVSGSQQVWEVEQLVLNSVKVPKSAKRLCDDLLHTA